MNATDTVKYTKRPGPIQVVVCLTQFINSINKKRGPKPPLAIIQHQLREQQQSRALQL